ncbi:MAG: aminoglycoside phosphotransferase family protein [Pseudomonadales bacterium]|jgi:aminoglycoside phosphotransferase (APT) family kinase protein
MDQADPTRMPAGKPDAEVDVDEALARRLIADQCPDLAGLVLRPLDSGWDNVIFRLGDAHTVRIPRRAVAAELVANEQTWLPMLAPRLPIPISAPERTGCPTDYYPWPWSVCPYFEGDCADQRAPAGSEADRFADFLRSLHQPAPADAPANPVRGIPIATREANTLERIERLRGKTDLVSPRILELWEAALAAPTGDARLWLHGDLHAQNVLVGDSGEIIAVIDWGDLNAGDVATDLAGIWALFDDAGARRRILERYAPDTSLLARARGWAVVFGVVLLDSGLINSPRHAEAGRRILERLAAE